MQIGAYDGIAGDPIRPLIINNCSWSGILVEPQRPAFSKLENNYLEQRSRLTFVNGLVSDTLAESEELFFIPETEIRNRGLPEWAHELASFDLSHIRKHFPDAQVISERMPAYSFDELADLLPDARVDLVVMDIEGAERRLIESIDFDKHRVHFLIFEHKHMSSDDIRCVSECLKQRKMNLKQFGRDTIAWRK